MLARILLGLSLALLAALVAAWFFWFGAKKFSEPYRMALTRVSQSEAMQQELGTPIRDVTWFPTGRISGQGHGRTARLNFTVAGPRGRATVSTVARCIGGSWGLTTLDVTFPDGGRRSIPVGKMQQAAAAPRWSPGEPSTGIAQSAARSPTGSPPPPGDIQIAIPTLPELERR